MPATKAVLDWRPEVRKYIKMPSTSESLIDAEVIQAARDFCRNTMLWQYDLDRISTVALQRAYPIAELPAEGGANTFVSIINARYKEDGMDDDQFFFLRMEQEQRRERESNDAAQPFETAPNPSEIFVDSYEENFLLYPIPENASTDGLLVRITVMPTVDTTDIPLFIWEQYQRTIAIGAASKLMGQTNRPWSNKKMSQVYWVEYLAQRDQASYQQWAGRTNRKLTVRPRHWGGSRSQDWIF